MRDALIGDETTLRTCLLPPSSWTLSERRSRFVVPRISSLSLCGCSRKKDTAHSLRPDLPVYNRSTCGCANLTCFMPSRSRSRSLSPVRSSKRKRDRSPSFEDGSLPHNAERISDADYFLKSDEFRIWLKEDKRKVRSYLIS